MRHSRWDLKGAQSDGPKEQPRRWNNGSSQLEWSLRNDAEAHPRMSSPPRHRPGPLATPPRLRGTPSPLDYRSESRRRHDNQNNSVSQDATGGQAHSSQQSSMGPPSTHFAGSWPLLAAPNIYPNSSQGHHPLAQYPGRMWGQNHPAYYPGDTGQYIFDLKWWAQQKQSMDAYLDGHCWRNDKNTHQSSAYPQWSFGTRVMKNYPKRQGNSRSGSRGHPQEGGFSGQRHDALYDPADHRRRHSTSSQRGQKHRDGMLEDHEQMDTQRRPSLMGDHGNRRNGAEIRDMSKIHSALHQPLRETWSNDNVIDRVRGGRGGKKNKKKQQNRFEFNLPNTFRGTSDFSKFARSASTGHGKMIKAGGIGAMPVVIHPRFGVSGKKNKSKAKGKSSKIDESSTYAEAAKKKALAAAANKLKRTFLAAKKKKTGGEPSAVDDDDDDDEDDANEMTEENNAQDLSMPRRHPSCLEFDIDIRFSAKEWASVGRGQGGTSNVLGRAQSPSSSKKHGSGNEKDGHALRDSRYACQGDGEEQEDSGTFSDSDLGKAGHHWTPILASHSFSRRRHLSESSGVMDLRKNPTNMSFNARPAIGRVRSCSLSVVEGASSSRNTPGYTGDSRSSRVKLHIMPKLRRLMLKQLLTMDKKSLQELVDDPRSRKAQFMMTHLMSEHRAALSQRLNQQRFKIPDDELQLLNSLDSSQLNSFPSDVVQQVREILAMEERGEGGSWEEVSLSVNDLLNADSDPDLDCQIISPPPRDPTSTITIHDSEDSEMEEALHNEDERDQEDDEEEEEEEEDEEEDEDDEHVEEDEEVEVPEVHHEDAVSSEAEDATCNREAPTPMVKASDIMPPVPVEVPLCVLDPITAGPSNSRDIADQVVEKISLMSPNQPSVNSQCPVAQELPVAGPSSILLTPAVLKVKEERPSPVSECGLCMHNPRTPHTSECLYQYGVAPPSPVPLMSGPPRPLGTTPPQRPVPHLPNPAQQPPTVPISSSLYQRSIKQEKLEDPYLKFEHVKRPSSEERPKNPAPPDAAREELLPLPIPPPAQALHPQPHPRPLIFSPDEDFPGPPRPPPPPPPQFSPRIKLERHTPVQFMCCCMRNECERNSTHSAEMRPLSRRSVATPQPNERRPTPHLYKMEPPSPCASRARTPHQSLPSIFAPPASPRCVNSLTMTGARVTVGVQTEKERHIPVPVLTYDPSCSNNYSNKRQYVPNLTLARSVTPNVNTKMDQSTTTDDLGCSFEQQQLRGKGRAKSWWSHRNGRPRNYLSQLSSISNSINEFEFSQNSGVALQQMMVLSEQESEFVRHIESLDQDIHELFREKKRITEELARLQNLRINKLQQLTRQGIGNMGAGGGKLSIVEHNGPRSSNSDVRTPRIYNRDSSSDGGDAMETGELAATLNTENISMRNIVSKDDACVQSTTDNASVVSSSQEKGLRVRSFSFSHTSSNDSSNESQSVRRQRCTSTCHSPGRSVRSKDVFQETYQGPFNTNEGFYQQLPSNSHKGQESASNTDSETDNDIKVANNTTGRSSEAIAVFDSVLQSTSRNRNNSFSSSAEGDVESEVPADHDEEEELKLTRLRLRMLNENEEAVVDSSEQRDENMHYEVCQNDLKELENVKQIVNCLLMQKQPLKEGTSVKNLSQCDPSTSRQNIKVREDEQVQRLNREVKIKEESPQSQSYPTSSGEGNKITEDQKYDLKSKQNDTTEETIKVELLRPSRTSCASASPSSSPDSQKCRNSSGEHCYSLRSRGPPTETVDCVSLGIDVVNEVHENSSNHIPLVKKTEKAGEEEHADDERENDEEDDDDDVSKDVEGMDITDDDKKRKRKRKTKKHRVNKKRKKKKVPESCGSKSPLLTASRRMSASPTSSSSQVVSNISNVELQNNNHSGTNCDAEMDNSGDERVFVNPPPHGCAVLDIKVVGDMVLTASSDGTARCYDMVSGRVMATYVDHTDVVTCVGVIGKPSFSPDEPDFMVITGSADKTICVFNGKTGEVKQHRLVGEGVRCLDIAWSQVFIGTEGGCGGRWNLKDKKVSEMVQYCGKALTNLKAMTEGGRRVLLVAAKTTPLMIRDAMSGLFLRTLEHIQLTVYATVPCGGLLYTGGSNKTIVYYDFTSGSSRGHIGCEADVSCLAIYSGHLIATCYDGLIRIFSIETGDLLQRIPVETTNKMFICSSLYKDRLLIGNKKGEVIGCQIPQITRLITR